MSPHDNFSQHSPPPVSHPAQQSHDHIQTRTPANVAATRPQPPPYQPDSVTSPYRDFPDDYDDKSARSESVSPSPPDVGWSAAGDGDRELMEKDHNRPPYSARAHYPRRPQRPLVDLVRNEWRTNPKYADYYRPPPDDISLDCSHLTDVLTSRRFRRIVLFYIVLVGLCWAGWHWGGSSLWQTHEEDVALSRALQDRIRTGEGWYGHHLPPEFTGMTHLKDLDSRLVPQGGKAGSKRLVVVGDVHGCKDELLSLLSKVSFDAKSDHLILTGDIISKGPYSPEAVDVAVSVNASCVRGNHEDRVLLVHKDLHSQHLALPGHHSDIFWKEPESPVDQLDAQGFPHGEYIDRQLAQSLTQNQIDYLSSCPVILRVGQINGMGEVSVVHAGLMPGVSLEKQDPLAVMTMKSIDLDTYVPEPDHSGAPWTKLWNKYQSILPKQNRSTVLYGHDSHTGLSLSKYSKGLDTGCVKGGHLSALIIEDAGKWRKAKTQVVHVKCKDYRPKELDRALGQS